MLRDIPEMAPLSVAKNFVEKTRLAIASKKFEEAKDICSEGLRHYPNNLRLNIQHGMILHHLGEKLSARDYFLALTKSNPTVAELELKLAYIAIANNETDEAECRLEAAHAKGGKRSAVLGLRADLARKKGDKDGECALLESVLEEADPLPIAIAVRLANVYSQLKAYEKALGLLQRVLEAAPDNINAYATLAGIAEAAGDGLLAERTLLRLIELAPDRPKWYARAQGLYLHLGQPDKAEEVLRAGLSKGLIGAVLLTQITAFPPIADLAEQILEWSRSVGDEAPENERAIAQSVLFHYAPSGFVVKADENVSIEDRQPSLSDWLALSPADKDLKRPVALESLNAEVQISRSTNSDCVVLVFLGLANRAMLPIGVLDRFFAALNCSALYIRDNRRLLGNKGIASMGESFDDTVHYLRKIIAELGGRRCTTVGTSAGGYPALRYGLELGAEKILCFSGLTNISAGFAAKDGRAPIVARMLQILPIEALDMRPRVIDGNGKSQIHLVYGDAHPQDAMHALYLEGCPGVHLHPLRDLEGHASMLVLMQQRGLLPMLRQLLEA